MKEQIKKIKKRDGRIVDFDSSKITAAIFKALECVGEPNFDLAQKLGRKVVENVGKKLPPGQVPKVEQIQDIVEQTLVEEGQAKIAKAYILYRQKRTEIRKQKQQILRKIEIDKVDKRFDLNALRVLCSRYLKKDTEGKIIESPKQLFERVAVHTTLPSIFFDKKIFQKRGGKPYLSEEFDPASPKHKLKIGKYVLNRFHLEGLKRMYDRFNEKGQLKLKFSELLSHLKKGEFANYEKEAEHYYNLMAERKFFPNTPALANFGNYLGMGSACFVVPVEDSIESIMDALKKAAIIFKSGGGVGYNFSNLRPKGDFVKTTGGVSSGPITFMTLFDKMSDVVKQGGLRRGASMGILNSDHPDVEEFITAKKGNLQLRNFNISVFIKEDFWDYFEKRKPYPLKNPRNGETIKYVDPQSLFNLIVYQAWESGEPGVVFDEWINKYNPFLKTLGPITCTNPCVVGDTLVAVADARNYVSIKQLAEEGKDVPVYCYGDGKVQIRMGRYPRKTREKVPVWKATLDDGSHIIATKDHKFRDVSNREIQLKDLKPGMALMPFYKFQYTATGKRTNYWGVSQNNGRRARAEHRMMAEFYMGRQIKKYPKEVVHHKNSDGLDNRRVNLEVMSQNEHDRFHQTGERNVMKGKWWNKLDEKQKETYRQKMSAVMSGEDNPTCALAFHKESIAAKIKEINRIKREGRRKKLYELALKFTKQEERIPTYKEFRTFAQQYGYPGDIRTTFGGFTQLKEELSLHNHRVVSVEFYGYEDVYNIAVDDFHTVAYITNPRAKTKFSKKPLLSGIITSQCGELPLYPHDSCNLASINVWAFCKSNPTNGREKDVEFDWAEFEKTIKLATKFLDNVIEVNKFPLKEIEEMTLNMRRIGLGIMGLADVLYELGIPYNSSEGLGFMEKLMEFLNYHSKVVSVELARQRGKFPYYDKSFYSQGKLPFPGIEKEAGRLPLSKQEGFKLDWQILKEDIKKYGLRNAQTTTNAPTGSISMIAGTSSGIEPNFSLVYEKKVAIGSFYYVNPVFEKVMEREGLFDEDLIKEVSDKRGSVQDLTYIPPKLKKIFVTAMDIEAKDHIKALASLQQWTDSSISKTINFPQLASVDDMREAYLLAHELGCKDLTVFRDQSIKGVLRAGARKEKKPKAEGELVSLRDVKAKGPVIYHDVGTDRTPPFKENSVERDLCPNCSTSLIMSEGCKTCPKCGWGVCAG